MAAWKIILRTVSILLILMGAGLLALVLGLYVYASNEQATALRQAQGLHADYNASTPLVDNLAAESYAEPPSTNQNPSSGQGKDDDVLDAERSSDIDQASLSPTPDVAPPQPTATPQPVPPAWIRIPKIDVDSPVVEARIKDGEWEVPKFVAGHLQGTANPGANTGNVVLTGHVQSLAAGNVFARIGELRDGDDVFLYGGTSVFPYRVKRTFTVKNNDLTVVEPTAIPTLTLITCTGTWNPLTRDYSERLIVVAEFVSLEALK